jgi:hypothetical protein
MAPKTTVLPLDDRASSGESGSPGNRTQNLRFKRPLLCLIELATRLARSDIDEVGPGGIEPPILRLRGGCSADLSYGPIAMVLSCQRPVRWVRRESSPRGHMGSRFTAGPGPLPDYRPECGRHESRTATDVFRPPSMFKGPETKKAGHPFGDPAFVQGTSRLRSILGAWSPFLGIDVTLRALEARDPRRPAAIQRLSARLHGRTHSAHAPSFLGREANMGSLMQHVDPPKTKKAGFLAGPGLQRAPLIRGTPQGPGPDPNRSAGGFCFALIMSRFIFGFFRAARE